MKTYIFLLILSLANVVAAQEETTAVAENIRVPEWVDFQNTQEKIVEQNTRMLSDLAEVRTSMRQINIKLIEIAGNTEQAAANAGRDVHCDALKTKYDPRLEWSVIALAFVGVYSIINQVGGNLKKGV